MSPHVQQVGLANLSPNHHLNFKPKPTFPKGTWNLGPCSDNNWELDKPYRDKEIPQLVDRLQGRDGLPPKEGGPECW